MYAPLLSYKQKPHVRRFAAESFGFLIRKLKNTENLLDVVFQLLAEHPEVCQ